MRARLAPPRADGEPTAQVGSRGVELIRPAVRPRGSSCAAARRDVERRRCAHFRAAARGARARRRRATDARLARLLRSGTTSVTPDST